MLVNLHSSGIRPLACRCRACARVHLKRHLVDGTARRPGYHALPTPHFRLARLLMAPLLQLDGRQNQSLPLLVARYQVRPQAHFTQCIATQCWVALALRSMAGARVCTYDAWTRVHVRPPARSQPRLARFCKEPLNPPPLSPSEEETYDRLCN